MRAYRRKFYNLFSRIYDKFVKLHSKDKGRQARKALVDLVDPEKDKLIVDLCTGTGTLLQYLADKSSGSRIIGIDFSRGMLKKAKEKTKNKNNIYFIEADVANMPLKNERCDKIICSHAFYELKGIDQRKLLKEVQRAMKPEGVFLIMEHEVPKNPIVKFLFYIRILTMGTKTAFAILKREEPLLKKYFMDVSKKHSYSSKSKIYICKK
ncbi:class I SAM-dependent methyltransferase [Flexistipes sinusarabici]|uniref:class I SAM-dependent methyltransferase n=1 Tax=Flexistipes sinusarabici TaxID=2352 RepID=UPI0026E9D3F9|nr:class I SAM-dependent methyltransferase [Flexistipes sinusarabici]